MYPFEKQRFHTIESLDRAWEEIKPAELDEVETSAAAIAEASEDPPPPKPTIGMSKWDLAEIEVDAFVKGVCAQCGKESRSGSALMFCERCAIACYCGSDCQRAAWRQHRDLCLKKNVMKSRTLAEKKEVRRKLLLWKSSVGGNVQHVKRLVESELITLEDLTPSGNTALHHAVVLGHSELVTWLLDEAGEDATRVNGEGDNAVKAAVQQHVYQRRDAIPGLEALLAWRQAYLCSNPMDTHSKEQVQRVAEMVDAPGETDGETPLCLAVMHRFLEALRLLLAHGARPELPPVHPARHGPPLALAAEGGYLPEVKLLVAADSSVEHINCQDGDTTPLMKATMIGRVPVVEWLLRQPGIDTSATRFQTWENVCHIAARNGNLELLELLLSPDLPCGDLRHLARMGDVDGDGAIHLAAYFGHVDCLEFLVRTLGAYYALQENNQGQSPLDVAESQGQHQAAKWLKAHTSQQPLM